MHPSFAYRARRVEPAAPDDPDRECCAWCGKVLVAGRGAEFFDRDHCFQQWHEWRNAGSGRATA